VDLAVAGAGDRRLAAVRAWWRVRHPPPSLGRRIDVAYTAAIIGGILGAVAYGTAGSALAEVLTPARLHMFGPAAALVGLVLTARWGAYQGPIVFTVADVGFLLGAPLPRRGLAARRLALALATGMAGGAALAGVLIVGLAGEGRGIAIGDAVALTAAVAELGALAVAAAWAVERSARWERAAAWGTWPAVALAGALVAGNPATPWPVALGALTLLTVLAAAAALRGCAHCPAERHMRRAEARQSAVASLAVFDFRTTRRSLEATAPSATRGRGPVLRRLGLPAVVWRDAASAARAPGRIAEAGLLAAAAAAVSVQQADRPLVVAAAMLVGYAAPARMLWPLRAELDVPDRTRVLLRPPIGRIMLEHTVVPATITAAGAIAGVTWVTLTGDASAGPALVAVVLAPVLTLCAAMAARRGGRLPQSLLVTGMAADPTGGGFTVIAWVAWWPSMAVVLGATPVLLAREGATLLSLAWLAVAAAGLGRLARREPPDS
jgi:hypothetical protein